MNVDSGAHAEITEEIATEPLNGRNNVRIEAGGIVVNTEEVDRSFRCRSRNYRAHGSREQWQRCR